MGTVVKLFLIVLSCFRCHAEVNDRYYPRYHLAPPGGWMNDPNGFCIFNGEYHLFYQHNPDSSVSPSLVHWGHAKSTDLFHWVNLPVALNPDASYDSGGVFSGSALVDNNGMHLFYTGNVGSSSNYQQYQALASSTDGRTFQKYSGNPIIDGAGLQPDLRDPKVWKHGNYYYMVLGNSFDNSQTGRVLLYRSSNMINWQQQSTLDQSDGSLGFMWECPDFFELDGFYILLFSPQGIEAQGDKYKNLYQTGYIVGHFDYTYNVFTPLTEFRELDFGHDFYATQTILDNHGRRLMVAWMDMWKRTDADAYPEAADGFTGQMTIIRTLSLTKDNRLIQKPVAEVNKVRNSVLYAGNSWGGTTITLPNKAGEVYIRAPRNKDFTLFIESGTTVVTILYEFLNGKVSLDRGGTDGLRRTSYRPEGKLELRAFIDASSIELFYGEGEVTFSSRFFPDGPISVRIGSSSVAEFFVVHDMKKTLYL